MVLVSVRGRGARRQSDVDEGQHERPEPDGQDRHAGRTADRQRDPGPAPSCADRHPGRRSELGRGGQHGMRQHEPRSDPPTRSRPDAADGRCARHSTPRAAPRPARRDQRDAGDHRAGTRIGRPGDPRPGSRIASGRSIVARISGRPRPADIGSRPASVDRARPRRWRARPTRPARSAGGPAWRVRSRRDAVGRRRRRCPPIRGRRRPGPRRGPRHRSRSSRGLREPRTGRVPGDPPGRSSPSRSRSCSRVRRKTSGRWASSSKSVSESTRPATWTYRGGPRGEAPRLGDADLRRGRQERTRPGTRTPSDRRTRNPTASTTRPATRRRRGDTAAMIRAGAACRT